MSQLYILENQDGLFLGRQGVWVEAREVAAMFKTVYKDEAVNQMVETSSKDYTQRIKIVHCGANEKGLPIVPDRIRPDSVETPTQD
jgi:hypothetical protein